MREIAVDELSKILKEHEKWIHTDKKKGKCADLRRAKLSDADMFGAKLSGADLFGANLSDADLSDADLRGVFYLTIEQLSKVKTLYKAKLDPELIEQVKDEYPFRYLNI
jgi:hypothetical protein